MMWKEPDWSPRLDCEAARGEENFGVIIAHEGCPELEYYGYKLVKGQTR